MCMSLTEEQRWQRRQKWQGQSKGEVWSSQNSARIPVNMCTCACDIQNWLHDSMDVGLSGDLDRPLWWRLQRTCRRPGEGKDFRRWLSTIAPKHEPLYLFVRHIHFWAKPQNLASFAKTQKVTKDVGTSKIDLDEFYQPRRSQTCVPKWCKSASVRHRRWVEVVFLFCDKWQKQSGLTVDVGFPDLDWFEWSTLLEVHTNSSSMVLAGTGWGARENQTCTGGRAVHAAQLQWRLDMKWHTFSTKYRRGIICITDSPLCQSP